MRTLIAMPDPDEPTRAELQRFSVGGTNIRFGTTEDGIPYSVASDFAKAMGYTRASDALSLLDPEEAGAAICRTRSASGVEQRRELRVIFEDGMWELIFRSTLPGAKAIKKQVKAILRQIRETGRYEVEPAAAHLDASTVTWDHAAAVARVRYGLNVDAHRFKELLVSGGILTTRNNIPHRKWEHLFWPVPSGTRWEIRACILPQLIDFAAKVRRELALAEKALQMSLPFPQAALANGTYEGDAS
ncbi:Bro-N domain-containing protein [Streptomyces canus]|uniref:BRO-N domain-containing protein n=1 Tax=Streptomyces canus TaxID=58343 RepID=UPI00224CC112|nr:Bro-N domain-containing protein [Streptomyces canus]MCX5253557.1 Bro-N domain-containing protein [Streptomyces canus]